MQGKSAYDERVEREEEEDRLAAIWDAKDKADRVGAAMELLFGLVDDGVIAGWSIKFPEPRS